MTILSSGFDITISDGTKGSGKDIVFNAGNAFEERSNQSSQASQAPDDEARTLIASEYGESKMTAHVQAMARANYVVLKPSQFDDDEVIYLFTKTPAYTRDLHQKDQIRSMGQSLAKDPQQPVSNSAADSANDNAKIVF